MNTVTIVPTVPAFSLAGKSLDATVLCAGFYQDATNFDRAVQWLKDTGSKMDTVIHAAAVYALGQSREHADGGHRNTDPIKRLMQAMPRSTRAKTLADWFTAFGNCTVSFDKKSKAWKVFLPASDKCEAIDMDRAMTTPFYSVEEKTEGPKAFNLSDAIAALIKRAESDKVTLSDVEAAVIADIKMAAHRIPVAA